MTPGRFCRIVSKASRTALLRAPIAPRVLATPGGFQDHRSDADRLGPEKLSQVPPEQLLAAQVVQPVEDVRPNDCHGAKNPPVVVGQMGLHLGWVKGCLNGFQDLRDHVEVLLRDVPD